MTRLRRALFVTVAMLTGMGVFASQAATADPGGDEMDLANRVNALRASRGLAPLAIRGDLFDIARARSVRMAATGTLSHDPAMGSRAPAGWTKLAENVGTGADASQVFEALLSSSVHYANMVDPAFQSIGVGAARNGAGHEFVTMTFLAGGSTPVMVKKVVRVCAKNRSGRTVCVRRTRMVPA